MYLVGLVSLKACRLVSSRPSRPSRLEGLYLVGLVGLRLEGLYLVGLVGLVGL